MNKVYLLIGGNIGNRRSYLKQSSDLIEQSAGKIVACSSIYETAAWGMEKQEAFLNQVILIETEFTARQLLNKILAIEEKLGRKRVEKYGPRIIDIDILLFNNQVINEPNLIVPHPALPDRRFALTPLCEIAADLLHPTIKKTMQQLLAECPDKLPVDKFTVSA